MILFIGAPKGEHNKLATCAAKRGYSLIHIRVLIFFLNNLEVQVQLLLATIDSRFVDDRGIGSTG